MKNKEASCSDTWKEIEEFNSQKRKMIYLREYQIPDTPKLNLILHKNSKVVGFFFF